MGFESRTIVSDLPQEHYLQRSASTVHHRLLKKGIWIYFFLLIFEGALRKWLLPGLSEPLLLIRDPLAMGLIFMAYKENVWRPNVFVILMTAISILALSLALLIGHANIAVAFFGLRITLVQFPLIFVIGAAFNKEDVLRLGEVLLWLNIGMTLLVAFQFFSPQSAFINRGVGGDINGSGFSGAAGFFRVPGTFSFTNGLAFFYGLTAAYIFYFWITKYGKKGFQILLLVSTLALLAAIPLSISRTVIFELALSFVFMLVITGKKVEVLPKILIAALAMGILLNSLLDVPFIKVASKAFTERFTTANKIEGGMEGVLVDRFLGGMYGAITDDTFPFWGMGLGMGTNAGAKILTGERKDGVFLISEGEWGRLIGEMGVVLGIAAILIRIFLVSFLMKASWKSISDGNTLPWMLLSFGVVILLQGQWAQPTALGFSVLVGGLVMASLKKT